MTFHFFLPSFICILFALFAIENERLEPMKVKFGVPKQGQDQHGVWLKSGAQTEQRRWDKPRI